MKQKIFTGCALGAGIALIANALVVLLLCNVWHVAQALAGAHVGAVLRQLTEAEITLPWLVSVFCAAVVAAAWIFIRKHRSVRIAAVILLALVCLGLTFFTTAVNDIPMHTALKAILALFRSEAL